MRINPLTAIDQYKADHRRQYPEGTTLVFSNLTPRSGKHATVDNRQEVVFFGLQYFVKQFLQGVWDGLFFRRPRHLVVDEYKRRLDSSLGKDAVPVDHIGALHDLGYLPLEIRAVPEGTVVPIGVPCLTIHNTRPEFFWLTNYLETVISAYLWLPCTTATTAWNYRELLDEYALRTGSPAEFVDFQAHDFSFRGMSSLQSAAVSGAAHLVFFKGTDTIPAIDLLEDYYWANADQELVGTSVPATEHSVMCMGQEGGELETFRRLITELYSTGIVSIVSDTWDFWRVITEYAKALHPDIIKRNGKVVFRPDSGNPADILCGDIEAPAGSSQSKGAVEVLWELFGGKITNTGHKLLDPHVGLIYGDSITFAVCKEILDRLHRKGFASANVIFGVGSFTYQHVTRDTWGFAMKATYGEVNGQPRSIFKAPKTDDGTKKSAKGLLRVVQGVDGKPELQQGVTWDEVRSRDNLLQPVFRDGNLLRTETLSGIRARAQKGFTKNS